MEIPSFHILPNMQDENIAITAAAPILTSSVEKMDIVKQKPFVLVYRIIDALTQEPLPGKRVVLNFSIQAASSPTSDLPNLLKFKDATDYPKQITDEKGDLACTFVINDVSRKYDPKGLIITATIDGSTLSSQSQVFKVISKRKADSGVDAEKPSKKVQNLLERIQLLEERVTKLEGQQ